MPADRADDLVPLLLPPPGPGLGYRQGLLTAYDGTTHANTVDAGGGVLLTDLPILATTGLVAGVAVGLLTIGTTTQSWLILGRITQPD